MSLTYQLRKLLTINKYMTMYHCYTNKHNITSYLRSTVYKAYVYNNVVFLAIGTIEIIGGPKTF